MANLNLIGVPKLKGREDFETWKFQAQATLDVEGLWEIVNGTERETNTEKLAVLNRKAKSRLILMIDPINFVHILDETTAKGVWEKLSAIFEDNGLSRRVGLLRALITTKLDECSSMEEFVHKIITTSHKLTNAGMKLNDEWIGTLLLAGLNSHYEPMIMAIESSGTKISSDAIKTKLLQDSNGTSMVKATGESSMLTQKRRDRTQFNYTPNKQDMQSQHGHHQFVHHRQVHQGNFNQHGQQRQHVFQCYKCGKPGHLARDCRSKINSGSYNSKNQRKESTWTCTLGKYEENGWYIDSGASAHMSKMRNNVSEVCESSSNSVTVANSAALKIEGQGSVRLYTNTTDINIEKVLIVPEICANLLSVSAMVKKGLRLTFNSSGCRIDKEHSGELVATASEQNGLYRLNASNTPSETSFVAQENSTMLWHRRLGHIGFEKLRSMSNDLKINKTNHNNLPCEMCILGKHARLPFPKSEIKSSSVLELIHTDVCGPMRDRSIQSSRYFVTFIDDYSRKVVVYGICKKSMVLDVLKDYKNQAENQTGKKIKIIRSDNGTEYCNRAMQDFCRSAGIVHQTSVPYTPQQNGVAERMNRTLVEKARCMIFDAQLPTKFWAEAVVTASFIINHIPIQNNGNTPEELWSNKKIGQQMLRVFGCKAMAYIPSEKRSKFDPTSKQCIFIGYCTTSKGYRLYDIESQKILVSRDVKFFENQKCEKLKVKMPEFNHFYLIQPNINEVEENPRTNDNEITTPTNENSQDESQVEPNNLQDPDYEPDQTIDIELPTTPRRTQRLCKPVNKYVAHSVEADLKIDRDPITLPEAMSSINSEKWKCAMNAEMQSLKENQTWTLVDLPDGRKAINNKWVFKTKIRGNGQIDKFKARLVVKGCSQRYGIDYNETFSPVVRYSTIRFLIAMAAKLDLEIEHMDAVTAFLQGDLKEEIYMKQPEGLEDGTERVCRLHKSLYGLKQASRTWNEKLNQSLIEAGLKCSKVDTCVYYHVHEDTIIVVAIYVDDLLIFSNNQRLRNTIKQKLMTNFKMIDNGEAKFVLGMHIQRDRKAGTVKLSQHKYLREILERFNMADCNPVSTPADPNVKLTHDETLGEDPERIELKEVPYQEAVGSLLFAAQVTRPDIQFAVHLVSRFNQQFNRSHWTAVKRIFRYLRGTLDVGITYRRDDNNAIHGYCDADWAGDATDRRSVTGYAFLLQGGAITWNTKKQPTVALSTTEAEYMAMSSATQEALWLMNLHNSIFGTQNTLHSIIIYSDNKSAILLSEKTTQFHPRTKHIDIRHHFIREKVNEGRIQLKHTPTQNMFADYLTKPVPHEKHKLCRENMNTL